MKAELKAMQALSGTVFEPRQEIRLRLGLWHLNPAFADSARIQWWQLKMTVVYRRNEVEQHNPRDPLFYWLP